MDDARGLNRLANRLVSHQRLADIAEISMEGGRIRVRPVGNTDWLSAFQVEHGAEQFFIDEASQQAYYFLAHDANAGQDLRPGSGIIRVYGGKSEGPAGTLTCFLSSPDGRDNYFVAAAHVLTNFWHDYRVEDRRRRGGNRQGQIYRNQKGFPATGSMRFLGNLKHHSAEPRPNSAEDKDIGIVRLRDGIEPVQRTTCYGTFDTSEPDVRIEAGLAVMKCGAEETHLTCAEVAIPQAMVSVYGPDGVLYRLKDQVILSQAPEVIDAKTDPPTDPPVGWSAAKRQRCSVIFAVPGDSGTLVVTKESRKPVGMLVAGSILDGRYVMTPFKTIRGYLVKNNLVLRRG